MSNFSKEDIRHGKFSSLVYFLMKFYIIPFKVGLDSHRISNEKRSLAFEKGRE